MTISRSWMEGEPSLEDLLADSVMDALLRRDGLTRADVRRAVEMARQAQRRILQTPRTAA